MDVVIFAGFYLPHVGGYCRNIHELAKRLVGRGHGIDVVTCNTENSPPVELIDGVRVSRLPVLVKMSEFPVPSPIAALRFLSEENDFDVAITQSRIFLTTALGALYAELNRVPLIHVERGGQHTITRNPVFTRIMRTYDHTIGRALMVGSSRVVAISEASRAFAIHLNSRASAVVIHNGICIPDLEVSLPPTSESTDIVFVGRLIYGKGVQDLITAFDVVNQRHKEARLWILGDGPYRAVLEKQADACSASEAITFLGEVDQSEVVELIGDGHIFVNPSYSEGMPTSVLEAASVGMPIVATDVGGTGEVIHDGWSGYLVEPRRPDQIASAIERIMLSWDKAKGMGARAREAVALLGWDGITDQWESLLKEACLGRCPG